jgi:hypothetical protein
VLPTVPVQTPVSPPRQPVHPDCPPIHVDSTKGDSGGGKGKGKGKGEQKKTMDQSSGSMSKLSQKTKGSNRRLGVHNNRPVQAPLVCPEIPNINSKQQPVQAPKSTGGKGETIASKVKPVSVSNGKGKGGDTEESTKTMFNQKKSKIEDEAARRKSGKDVKTKERQKKSMR